MRSQDASADLRAPHRWRAAALGAPRTVETGAGALDYFDRGSGPILVFAHGWLANANLWRRVVEALCDGFRCVTLDLPFGSHRRPMRPDADLTPGGCGRIIAEVLEALDLHDVTLVGNDSGGAYSQIATASWPERVGRLVLTSCETPYDEFPPEPFALLPKVAATPEGLRQLLSALEDPAVRTTPAAYGLLAKRPIEAAVSDSYALPCLRDSDVLRDTSRVMRSASTALVRAAGERLIAERSLPVLLVWSAEDPLFPIDHARRYAAALRQARLETIEDSYSFTPEDQPEVLARAIQRFSS